MPPVNLTIKLRYAYQLMLRSILYYPCRSDARLTVAPRFYRFSGHARYVLRYTSYPQPSPAMRHASRASKANAFLDLTH